MKLRLPSKLQAALIATLASVSFTTLSTGTLAVTAGAALLAGQQAQAFISTTTTYDGTVYNGSIWTWNNFKDGESVSSNNSKYTQWGSDPAVVYIGGQSVPNGPSKFYNYFFNDGQSNNVGNTLRFDGNPGNIRLNTDWTNSVWVGGIITTAGNTGTYTFGRDNTTTFRLNGTGAVNMSIESNFKFRTNTYIYVEKGGTWKVAKDKKLTFSANNGITVNAGQNVAIQGEGTVEMGNALTLNGGITVGSGTSLTAGSGLTMASTGATLVNNGVLTLGGTIKLGAAGIENNGTVTFNTGFKLDLSQMTATNNTYTIFTGDNTFDFKSITIDASNLTGVVTAGKNWSFNSDGTISFADQAAMVWTCENLTGTWDYDTPNWNNGQQFARNASARFDGSAIVGLGAAIEAASVEVAAGQNTVSIQPATEGSSLSSALLIIGDGANLQSFTAISGLENVSIGSGAKWIISGQNQDLGAAIDGSGTIEVEAGASARLTNNTTAAGLLTSITGEGEIKVTDNLTITGGSQAAHPTSVSTGTLTVEAGKTLTVGTNKGQYVDLSSFTGVVLESGAGLYLQLQSLTLQNLTLNGPNAHEINLRDFNAVNVNNLDLQGTTTLNSDVSFVSGWKYKLNIEALTGNHNVTLSGGSGTGESHTVTIGTANIANITVNGTVQTVNFTGAVTLSGGMTLNDANTTLTANGAFTATGALTINRGTVNLAAASSVGSVTMGANNSTAVTSGLVLNVKSGGGLTVTGGLNLYHGELNVDANTTVSGDSVITWDSHVNISAQLTMNAKLDSGNGGNASAQYLVKTGGELRANASLFWTSTDNLAMQQNGTFTLANYGVKMVGLDNEARFYRKDQTKGEYSTGNGDFTIAHAAVTATKAITLGNKLDNSSINTQGYAVTLNAQGNVITGATVGQGGSLTMTTGGTLMSTIANTGSVTMGGAWDVSSIEPTDPSRDYVDKDGQPSTTGNGFAVTSYNVALVTTPGSFTINDGTTFTYGDATYGKDAVADGKFHVLGTEANYSTYFVNSGSPTLTEVMAQAHGDTPISTIAVTDSGTLDVDDDFFLAQLTKADAETMVPASSGTINIRQGVTVTATDSENRPVTLSGAGTLDLNGQNSMNGAHVGENWTGTVVLKHAGNNQAIDERPMVNGSLSTLQMEGFSGWFGDSRWYGESNMNIKLVNTVDANGATVSAWKNGAASGLGTYTKTFSGTWSGDGTFERIGSNRMDYAYTGNIAAWNGKFLMSAGNRTDLKFYGGANAVNIEIARTAGTLNVEAGDGSNAFSPTFSKEIKNISALTVKTNTTATFNEAVTAYSVTVNGDATATFQKTLTLGDNLTVAGTDGHPAHIVLNGDTTVGRDLDLSSSGNAHGDVTVASGKTLTYASNVWMANNNSIILEKDAVIHKAGETYDFEIVGLENGGSMGGNANVAFSLGSSNFFMDNVRLTLTGGDGNVQALLTNAELVAGRDATLANLHNTFKSVTASGGLVTVGAVDAAASAVTLGAVTLTGENAGLAMANAVTGKVTGISVAQDATAAISGGTLDMGTSQAISLGADSTLSLSNLRVDLTYMATKGEPTINYTRGDNEDNGFASQSATVTLFTGDGHVALGENVTFLRGASVGSLVTEEGDDYNCVVFNDTNPVFTAFYVNVAGTTEILSHAQDVAEAEGVQTIADVYLNGGTLQTATGDDAVGALHVNSGAGTVYVTGDGAEFGALDGSGTLDVAAGTALTGATLTVAEGQTLNITGGGTLTYNHITNDGTLGIGADTTVTVDEAINVSTGETFITAGYLGGAGTYIGGNLTVAGGSASLGSLTQFEAVTVNNSGSIAFDAATQLASITASSGTIGINAGATVAGTITVSGGTLDINGATSAEKIVVSSGKVTINAATELTGADSLELNDGSSNNAELEVTGNATLTAARIKVPWGFKSFVVDGTVNLSDALQVSTGGATNPITGTGTINTQSLLVGNQTTKAIFKGGLTLNIGSGGIDGTNGVKPVELQDVTVGVLDGANGWTGVNAITLAAPTDKATTFNIGKDKEVTLNGALSGTGKLSVTGGGTLNLNAANSFSGNLDITGTTVVMGDQSALGSSNAGTARTITIGDGGAVDLHGTYDVCYAYTLDGGSLLNNGTSIDDNKKQTMGLNVLKNSSIGGSGNFDILNSGYGATRVSLNNHTLTKVGSDRVRFYNTTFDTAGTLEVQDGILWFRNDDNFNGAMTFVLNDATAGTGENASIQGGSAVNVKAGLTVDAKKTAEISLPLALQNNSALSVNVAAEQTLTMSGAITGGSALTKAGAGALALTGASEFTSSAITLQGGTLTIGENTTFSDAAVTVSTAASTLAVNGTLSLATTTPIQVDGVALTLDGTGTIDLSKLTRVGGDSYRIKDNPEVPSTDGNGFTVTSGDVQFATLANDGTVAGGSGLNFTYNGAKGKLSETQAGWVHFEGNPNYETFTIATGTETLSLIREWSKGGTETPQVQHIELAGAAQLNVDQAMNTSMLNHVSGDTKGVVNIDGASTVMTSDGSAKNISIKGNGIYELTNVTDGNWKSVSMIDELDSSWTGTVKIANVERLGNINLNTYGHTGSSVMLDNVTGYMQDNVQFAPQLKIGAGGFTVIDGSSNKHYYFAGGVSGEGAFTYNLGNPDKMHFHFSGDVSGWTGSFLSDNANKTGTLYFESKATVVKASIDRKSSTLNLVIDTAATFGNEVEGTELSSVKVSTLTVNDGKSATFNGALDVSGAITLSGNASLTLAGETAIAQAIVGTATSTVVFSHNITSTGLTGGERAFYENLDGQRVTEADNHYGVGKEDYITVVTGNGNVTPGSYTVTQNEVAYALLSDGTAYANAREVDYTHFYVQKDSTSLEAIMAGFDGHSAESRSIVVSNGGTLNVDTAVAGVSIEVTDNGTITGGQLAPGDIGIDAQATATFTPGITDAANGVSFSAGATVKNTNEPEGAKLQYDITKGNALVTADELSASAESGVQVNNQLAVKRVENTGTGALVLTGPVSGATLNEVLATNGNVTFHDYTPADNGTLETLAIASGKTVGFYEGGVADTAHEASVTVSGTLTAGSNAHLNSNLEMASGSHLDVSGAQGDDMKGLIMGSEVTLNHGSYLDITKDPVTGDPITVDNVNDYLYNYLASGGHELYYLFDSVDTLTINGERYDHIDFEAWNKPFMDAHEIYENLNAQTFYVTYNGSNVGSYTLAIGLVPEPTTGTLSLLALAALAARRRRK